MKIEITSSKIVQAIILNISGLYAQIHDQKYCNEEELAQVKKRYSDTDRWYVVVLDFVWFMKST